ncbi:MAG: DUF4062 domain-containing protein [Candidatus Hydrogenedentes bacterium]|nr:DUF4062 domain-containing protein [Candidatus Hydrogenedentota bacterium]
MSTNRKHQVFVSSTFSDLDKERLGVLDVIAKMGCIAAGMELFPASHNTAWREIKRTIDESDYYLLILGSRYGSPGPDGISYTEMEYRYALELEIPIVAFVRKLDNVEELINDPLEIQKFIQFRSLVSKRLFKHWVTTHDLQIAVSTSLHQLISDYPSQGWLRANPKPISTPETTLESSETQAVSLRALIASTSWIVGAVNFDEDLHFSSFYLRASAKKNLTKEIKELGYSAIIAIYEDFNERYYLPESECGDVAKALVEKMLMEPDWFQKAILDQISLRLQALTTVFKDTAQARPFENLTDKQILALYKKHNDVHSSLYEVARIPETLDRGVGYFTKYLNDYPRARLGPSASPSAVGEVFSALTQPEEKSKKLEELEELLSLSVQIRHAAKDGIFQGSSKRMLLELDPEMLGKIMRHRDRWSFWGYHGYGTRATFDINHYLKQIGEALTKGAISGIDPVRYSDMLKKHELRRIELFGKLDIDSRHQMLFRFYSRIGNAKLSRRFVQLRNFYYLDLLMIEISRRLHLREGQVRSLLPEEVENLLRSKKRPAFLTASQRARTEKAVFIISSKQEAVLSGKDLSWVKIEIKKYSRPESSRGRQLTGNVLCQGIAQGRAVVINRREDAIASGFKKGDILVSQAADPELAEVMAMASAVLVETGGVTCHAAIICRELGKPALSNIHSLLEEINTDDYVVVDAYNATVEIRRPEALKYCKWPKDLSDSDSAEFGKKATTLAQLSRSGMNVPRFFAISLNRIEFTKDPQDAIGPEKNDLIEELKIMAESLDGPMFIIRSSFADEDADSLIAAGQYPSISNIDKEDFASTILGMVERASGLPKERLGSLIVQDMVLADYSGVCITEDAVTAFADKITIEIVPGSNEILTNGNVVPKTYSYNKNMHVVDEVNSASSWGRLVEGEKLREIAEACIKIETICGQPQDIEWTLKEDTLWILQSRSIRRDRRRVLARADSLSHIEHGLRDISIICRAYYVPPNVKLHLLRVAAIGDFICAKWNGPRINRAVIIKALLLHDIGNIVKADYRRYPDLFPEETRNLKYWIAVQQRIRDRFGETDLKATLNIARDIGVDNEVLELIQNKQFLLNQDTLTSDSWERKIAAYADQRVGPHGVLGLNARLAEARRRYHGVDNASVNSSSFDQLASCAIEIENKLQKNMAVLLRTIDDACIAIIMNEIRREPLF